MNTARISPARRGNALVVGFAVIAVAGAMAVASVESFVVVHNNSGRELRQASTLAALDAVLTRRETKIQSLAASGDPAEFGHWTDNYGVDYVGDCEIVWAIEPVRTPSVEGTDQPVNFISNPSPDQAWTAPSGATDPRHTPARVLKWQPNDYIYLFRIRAESRIPSPDRGKYLARSQGVRFVSINNQPLFRWVIFYAGKGPKGDLEISHGSNLNILGNVHSNGSIYLGSSPSTNMWGALQPSTGFTEIGPYGGAWGAWANATLYLVGARIAHGGVKYRCVSAHTSTAPTEPGVGASWQSTWQRQWTDWTVGTTYAIVDRVERGGVKYKCTSPHTAIAGNEPGSGALWHGYWDAVADVRVTGVDGVFRLSKQIMIGGINSLPMYGTAPDGFSTALGPDFCFNLVTAAVANNVVGEAINLTDPPGHYLLPGGGSLFQATYDGVVVNPNRVRIQAPNRITARTGLGTVVDTSIGTPNDDRITINGTPVLAVADGGVPDNDSRDVDRGAANKWPISSRNSPPSGFNHMVRNAQTGGKEVNLPKILQGRPLEAQALSVPTTSWVSGDTYVATLAAITDICAVNHRGLWWACIANHVADASNEPGVGAAWAACWRELSADPHQFARPIFQIAGGAQTTDLLAADAGGLAIEVPGQYQRFALGSGSILLRRRAANGAQADSSGWTAVDKNANPASLPNQVGLTIRERIVPDESLYLPPNIVPLTAPGALPYAYGKHRRPSTWPFTSADVTSESFIVQSTAVANPALCDSYAGSTSPAQIPVDSNSTAPTYLHNRAYIHINESASTQSYVQGGTMEMRSACNPGSHFPHGWFDPTANVYRKPYWFAENWRLIQLAQHSAVTEASGITGLSATYYNDAYWNTKMSSSQWQWHGPFGGTPVAIRNELTGGISVTPGANPPAPGCGTTYFSVRWEGFLRPTATFSYEFRATNTWGTRVWINGQRLIDGWKMDSAAHQSSISTAVTLTANQNYPIIIEWFHAEVGTPEFLLQWRQVTGAWATVPGAILRPRLNDAATRDRNASDWASFSAAQFKIDRLTGNALQKVGLMLRGGSGLPLLQDGREPYAAMLYSPTRGFHMQARGQRSQLGRSVGPTKFVGRASIAGTDITTNGNMESEDRNNDGYWNAGEDLALPGYRANTLDDPTTVTRKGRLIPIGPIDAAPVSAIFSTYDTYYRPSTAGPATFLTGTGVTGSGITDTRFTNLTIITNPPMGLAEGTVDKVYVGPLTLECYEIPRAQGSWLLDREYAFIFEPGTIDALAAFVHAGTPNDRTRVLRMYQTGEPSVFPYGDALQGQTGRYRDPGIISQSVEQVMSGTYFSWLLAATTHWGVTVLSSATTTNGFNQHWRSLQLGAWAVGAPTATATTPAPITDHTIFYLTSTPADTRPKIYSGATYIRTLSAAETETLMEATYGGNYTVEFALPAWPNPPDGPTPAAVLPAQGSYDSFPEVCSIRGAFGLPLTDPYTIPTTDASSFRIGEYYRADDEWVRCTAISLTPPTIAGAVHNVTHTVTVARGQLGSTFVTHVSTTKLISPSPAELTSALNTTDTTFNVTTFGGLPTIQVDDILRIPNASDANHELMRVTGVAGPAITVTRGIMSLAAAHSAGVRIIRPVLRSFRLDRQQTVTFDHNSFTSAGGNINPLVAGANNVGWFWTNQQQYRPWTTLMPASTIPTTTGAFQPDMWYPHGAKPTPPTDAVLAPIWRVSATMPSSGQSTASVGSTPGTVTDTVAATPVSPRWNDDVPVAIPLCPPFGSADIWLRIERVATTDQLRFMWRNSDAGPFTALTRTDGTEVRLDVGRWFNQTTTTTSALVGAAATDFPVNSITGFAVGDAVRINGTNVEIGHITVITPGVLPAGTLTIVRGELGTGPPSGPVLVDVPSGSAIVSLSDDWLGPDMNIAICEQGGPRYWTQLTGAASISAIAPTSQVWAVESTAGMTPGDLVQIGGERERVRINSVLSPTSVDVSRGWDGSLDDDIGMAGSQLPAYAPGTTISSLTNPAANVTTLLARNMQIETTLVGNRAIIDSADWEEADGGARALSQYLASQYQVFWGPLDITEDFFTFNEGTVANRLANEDWIYNTREFWSQSRWWDDANTIEKDSDLLVDGGNGNGINHDETSVRAWLSKCTLLTLNMRAVQDYIKTRTLDLALADVITTGGDPPLVIPNANTYTLKDHFNGLFYLVRSNRYPTNPTPGMVNPWNRLLPNLTNNLLALEAPHPTYATSYGALLQPYLLTRAPAFKPQQFHHGVRVINGSNIDWGHAGTPPFGTSKTTIATPNQLFIQGDLNTVPHVVSYQGGTPSKLTPTAVMGDAVTLLSNSWNDARYKNGGLTCAGVAGQPSTWVVSAGGTLAFNQLVTNPLPTATSTSYFASILTHNQPTTRASVRLGESSAFINTMMYLEDWVGSNMNFLGSLVVMDSRRYSESYLLDSPKAYGRTPFGYMANTGDAAKDAQWRLLYDAVYDAIDHHLVLTAAPATNHWGGQIGAVQGPPARSMDFNNDLLSEAGTPPFTPFGVTASGVGAWSRVIE